ncbi:hypothetical protein BEL04_18290 [Mucilaginibacter sp. PPCGB 2223]|uniref:helix-turn-helix transcriptional regulator n=1 Tax=Mucilaginibacter sp. PPCGB 2223 TaxID=1886027 RepID=UPI0008251158|nr:helix-turn-helix transcriptional regulator [Mucilaginibacter sp. PPCGB 2223]OCX51950.1 hypothetical protein BEL04_18290 [Mucilaginibacter sp. PPCGB 2223]
MELIERAGFLASLQSKFEYLGSGEGHCVLLGGEAGIGKTSLVKAFCKTQNGTCRIYTGTCDALFTPRPLAPLYDIAWQLKSNLFQGSVDIADRSALFTKFLQELSDPEQETIVVFEDIHWADEATIDFIKFLARRIIHTRCFFILTYRDNEIGLRHPLRNILGHLPPDSFTRLQLTPLSPQAVDAMAVARGYSGEDVYSITGGNPFYVNEILASYSPGIPDNIKDSILSVYNSLDERTKHIWQTVSVFPAGFEIKYLEKMEPGYSGAIENCLALKVLIPRDGIMFFKHELYRRAIEDSLSPMLRARLNKRILGLFRGDFEQSQQIERIIHHAKHANEYELVVHYAPLAARQAMSAGCHIQAASLYLSAIEYYQGNDKAVLIELYEAYSYECYLTNQIKEAIAYQQKVLGLLEKSGDTEKTGNCMRFLSRLWWFDGNRKQAESFAQQAIDVLDTQPPSVSKAKALSNMSQLKMLSNEIEDCISWGEQAMAMALELNDNETYAHALNNVGTAQMGTRLSHEKGLTLLKQSLEICLKNAYHEHAARAFTNIGNMSLAMKNYAYAKLILEEGISYCEERDLDSWSAYMSSLNAQLKLETGSWDEALCIADSLLQNENQVTVIKIGALTVKGKIKMRRGNPESLQYLSKAKVLAFETMELQRIAPVLASLLEYEWITGKNIIEPDIIDRTLNILKNVDPAFENNELVFWMFKARKKKVQLKDTFEGYHAQNKKQIQNIAALWEGLGCAYEQALILFDGNDVDKRKAINIIQKLGADAVYQKMKTEMRTSGIKSIPRGIRESTRSNKAYLTTRELDILALLKEGLQNREIAGRLFISAKTVDHHISSILLKLNVNNRIKAVQEAINLEIIK